MIYTTIAIISLIIGVLIGRNITESEVDYTDVDTVNELKSIMKAYNNQELTVSQARILIDIADIRDDYKEDLKNVLNGI